MKTSNMADFRVSTHITHAADLDAFETTEDGRMYANIRIIKAGTSKNRRTYPPSVVKEAVDSKFWDGTLMFTNHDRKRPEVDDRGFREMVSAIESTSWNETDKSAEGRVEFFDRPFFEKVQRAKDYIGVSINSVVKGTRRTVAGEVHEDVSKFHRSRSVDWVFNPSAGGAILAFEDEDDEVGGIDWTQVTVADLKANNAAVFEAIQKEALEAAKTGPDDDPDEGGEGMTPSQVQEAIQAGIKKDREEQEKRDKARTAAQIAIKQAFANSGLPDVVQHRVMRSFESVETFDENAVTEAIKEAKEELKAVGAGPQIKEMGQSGSSGGDDGKPSQTLAVHESVKATFGMKPKKAATTSDDSEES